MFWLSNSHWHVYIDTHLYTYTDVIHFLYPYIYIYINSISPNWFVYFLEKLFENCKWKMLRYVLVPTYITTIIHKAEGKGLSHQKRRWLGVSCQTKFCLKITIQAIMNAFLSNILIEVLYFTTIYSCEFIKHSLF